MNTNKTIQESTLLIALITIQIYGWNRCRKSCESTNAILYAS